MSGWVEEITYRLLEGLRSLAHRPLLRSHPRLPPLGPLLLPGGSLGRR